MRVLFLCEGTTVPASRFRVAQFVGHLEAAGIDCVVRYAYDSHYNRWRNTRLGPAYKLLWRMKRIPYSADADEFDLVFVQRPAVPFSALPERLTASINPRIVFDFDDSIHLDPQGDLSSARKAALDETVDLAQWVIAGNRYLADVAGVPHKTTIIPTVIDTDVYVPATHRATEGFVIGWMGTSSNFQFLERVVEPVERALDAIAGATVRIVSNEEFAPWADHPRVEQIPWSSGNELAMLQSFDVGLMPLVDEPLTRGKCAFKMIQYMAVGCPVVVSAVGANIEVFDGSDAGFCVDDFDAFTGAIVELARDPVLRARAGAKGRACAVAEYSIGAVLPVYLEIFDRVAAARIPARAAE